MSQSTKQVRVVTQAEPTPGQDFEPTAFFDEDGNPVELGGGGEGGPVAFADLTGVPAALTAAQAAATASIRALGTGATQAAAGNHTHTATATTATAIGPGTATNVQGILAELAARITALENQ